MPPLPDHTPLTEPQAKSLAHWWGGVYLQISGPEKAAVSHGVAVSRRQSGADQVFQIFSLEEAGEMENRRGFQEAASPDWVG